MYNSKIIRHADLIENELKEIIKIKSVAWPYSYEKQIEWINNNLKDSDLHFLLLFDKHPIAYLNLVTLKIKIDNTFYDALGIGNVCSIEKGKGYGNELMNQTNHFLNKETKIGLLFCKYNLVAFYKKFNWRTINKSQLFLNFDNNIIETMIFNYDLPFKSLTFTGKLF